MNHQAPQHCAGCDQTTTEPVTIRIHVTPLPHLKGPSDSAPPPKRRGASNPRVAVQPEPTPCGAGRNYHRPGKRFPPRLKARVPSLGD
jgi:hypothetical protein